MLSKIYNFSTGDDVYVTLPGMAPAAVVLVDLLQSRGANVHIVRFGQQSTAIGMTFPFKEIVSLRGYINL